MCLLAKALVQSIPLLDVPASSRASPLPQGLWPAVGLAFTEDQNCGSEPARESGGSVDISVVSRHLCWMCRPLREQARSHRDCGQPWDWRSLKINTVGASLLAKAVGQSTSLLDVPDSSRASPLPQGLWSAVGLALTEDQNCESEPARESVGSVDISVGCVGLFASKLAPTGIVASRGIGVH